MMQRIVQLRGDRHGLAWFGVGPTAWATLATILLTLTAQAQINNLHPKRHDQLKHQVEKIELEWRNAELADDVDAMSKLLSDDYYGITLSGQVVTKTQQLNRMRNRRTTLTRIDLSDTHVKLIGAAAIVTSLAEVEGTNDDAPMHGTFRYTRVYSRSPSGVWKITHFEATRVGPPPPNGGTPSENKHPREDAPKPE
jgi:ketosteroid isomerase-like protein